MPGLASQLDFVLEFAHDTVDARVDVAPSSHLLELFAVGPFAPTHHGGQDLHPASFGEFEYAFGHLAHGLGRDGQIAARAMGLACPGEEEPQVIRDLGGCAHRASRAAADTALLDGKGWRDSFNGFHLGLFELIEKLPSVGGKGFHVAPLAFGVERVESQAGFPGARRAGEYDELIPGDPHVHPTQVVGSCSAHHDFVMSGCAAESGNRIQQAGRRVHGRVAFSA